MHQSFVTTAPPPPTHTHLRGWAEDSGANVQGSDRLSYPAVPEKCRASDIMQIYPRGIYYYKERGYDTQQVTGWIVFDRYYFWGK